MQSATCGALSPTPHPSCCPICPTLNPLLPRLLPCALQVGKVVASAQCLIVAPDICVSSTAHINPVRALQRILHDAALHGVPVVFALSRKGIGQVRRRTAPGDASAHARRMCACCDVGGWW